jgi:hypothetical protein
MTPKRKETATAAPAWPDAAPQSSPVGLPAASPSFPAPALPAAWTPLFWRLFGVVVAGVVAVIGVTVYLHMQANLSAVRQELSTLSQDMRRDLSRLAESYGTMIKKDDHNNRLSKLWDTMKELRADRSDLTTLKERCSVLLEVYRAGEDERRALAAEVRRLSDSKTATAEREALVRDIRALRERLAQLENPRGKSAVQATEHAEEQEKP